MLNIQEIAQAIGLQGGERLWLGGHESEAKLALKQCFTSQAFPPTGAIDCAIVTPSTMEEFFYFAQKVRARLSETSTVWCLCKSELVTACEAGSPIDSSEAEAGGAMGLVFVSSRTFDDWSLLMFAHPAGSHPL